MKVKVLGSGCKKCIALEKNAIEAAKELGIEANIEHIKDINEIADYGVLRTPALVVEENVVSMGKVLTVSQLSDILKKY